MLGDLSTYSLRDFVPLTPDVYFRLFERQNEAVWPVQILAVLLGVALLWLAWRGRGRWIGLLLGVCWAFVGWTFHLELYANLNWAAEYFGWAFIAQGALLVLWGFLGRLDARPGAFEAPQRAGLTLAAVGLFLFPFIGPLAGRAWSGVGIFGVAPDPTVIVTLGLVLVASRARWLLLLIPTAWSLVSAATSWVMEAPSGLVTPVLALVALGVALWKSVRAFRARS